MFYNTGRWGNPLNLVAQFKWQKAKVKKKKQVYIICSLNHSKLQNDNMAWTGQMSFIHVNISTHLNLSSFVSDGFLCIPDVLLQCVFFPKNTKSEK